MGVLGCTMVPFREALRAKAVDAEFVEREPVGHLLIKRQMRRSPGARPMLCLAVVVLVALSVIISQDANGRAVEILILTTPQRPEESRNTQATEKERYGDGESEYRHSAATRLPALTSRPLPISVLLLRNPRRRALPITIMDEPDIAIAAISGVT